MERMNVRIVTMGIYDVCSSISKHFKEPRQVENTWMMFQLKSPVDTQPQGETTGASSAAAGKELFMNPVVLAAL